MLTLRKMTEVEFIAYHAQAVPNYADEKMKGEDLENRLWIFLKRNSRKWD